MARVSNFRRRYSHALEDVSPIPTCCRFSIVACDKASHSLHTIQVIKKRARMQQLNVPREVQLEAV